MVKKFLKVIAILLGALIFRIVLATKYIKAFLPYVEPAPDNRLKITDEIVDPGRYLANHVMLCMDRSK